MMKPLVIDDDLVTKVRALIWNTIYDMKNNAKVLDYVISYIWKYIHLSQTKEHRIKLFRLCQLMIAVQATQKYDHSRPVIAYHVLYGFQKGRIHPKYTRELINLRKALNLMPLPVEAIRTMKVRIPYLEETAHADTAR